MKESRNRDNNTKKTEYILNERCKFCKKKLSMTKKKVVRNFGENRRQLFQDFLSENKFPKIFCPPNICDPNFCPPIFMTSLRRCVSLYHRPTEAACAVRASRIRSWAKTPKSRLNQWRRPGAEFGGRKNFSRTNISQWLFFEKKFIFTAKIFSWPFF